MKKLSIYLILFSLISLLPSIASAAAPKENTKCTSVGKLSGKFTCISLDGKKFWYELTLASGIKKYARVDTDCYRENMITKGYNKSNSLIQLICKYNSTVQGTENPKWVEFSKLQSIVSDSFDQVCNLDSKVPTDWVQVEKWAKSQIGCARPYRFVQGSMSSSPTSQLSVIDKNVQACKLANSERRQTGFPRASGFQNFTKSAVFQVVPIDFADYRSKSDPIKDYQKYIDFISEYLKNASDVEVNPIFKLSKKYFSLAKNIDYYEIEYGKGSALTSEIMELTKNDINYSGVDLVLAVIPPTVPADTFFAGGLSWGEIDTPQGKVKNIYVMGPTSLTQRNKPFSSTAADPWITIHEAIGHHSGLNDTLGDGKGTNGHIGMGGWGQMAGINGDFVVWDKWLMGFVSDSQIACISDGSSKIVWIRPNTIKNSGIKAAIIPLGNREAIVIESQRSVGYNFKIPKKYNGALIYKVDSSVEENDVGSLLLNTENISYDGISGMRFGDATLKQGRSFTYQNWKITVIESGDFGDVVKIEKVS